jgi:Dehydrogenases with different specificities (related to short-chain alcohol dehydrogenases)
VWVESVRRNEASTSLAEQPTRGEAVKVVVTGSASGLGHDTAEALLDDGHQVVVHVRNDERRGAVADICARGATVVVGDLSDPAQTRRLVPQIAAEGPIDAIVHNAGILSDPGLLQVNVLAPFLLTALVPARRQIYLSSSMHHGGRAGVDGIDWTGHHSGASYSDSKLLVTILSAAVARLVPATISSAVDPGWVPTRMGGAGATDDLRLGHLTQQWLATSDDPAAVTTGGYWHHQQRRQPHPAVLDTRAQDALVHALEQTTGVTLTPVRKA